MYIVVGKGMFTAEKLIELLESLGVENPALIISRANTTGKVICGDLRILAMR